MLRPSFRRSVVLLVCSCALAAVVHPLVALEPRAVAHGREARQIRSPFAELPLRFEAADARVGRRVRFLSRQNGYHLFLTATEAVLVLRAAEGDASPSVLRVRPVGAHPEPRVFGIDPLPGKTHYLIGNDPKRWRTDVPAFARVKYEDVYAGIDLVYYGNPTRLEFDFVVEPGADPEAIRVELDGADHLAVDARGDLDVRIGERHIRLLEPLIHQEIDGVRRKISGRYVLRRGARVPAIGFAVDHYDAQRALVIDPVLVYSTYLGSSVGDTVQDIAVDGSGNAYVTGWTLSIDGFPTTDGTLGPNDFAANVFVTKLSADGSTLVYSTYLGGSHAEQGYGIAVDAAGRAYVTGRTGSADFPTRQAIQEHPDSLSDQAFISVLNPDGSDLDYSTYLGGIFGATGRSIAVDAAGHAYVTGRCDSSDFPVTPSAYRGAIAGVDAFVTRIDPGQAGADSLVYSTFLGGTLNDVGDAIAVDSRGIAWVTGVTGVPGDFPVRRGFLSSQPGGFDSYITGIDTTTTGDASLFYSSYLGGTRDENLGIFEGGIAVDAAGHVLLTGTTASTDFPTTTDAFQRRVAGGVDVFVTMVDPSRSGPNSLIYSTLLGGAFGDVAYDIAVGPDGNAFVTGAASAGFPATAGGLGHAGASDAFLATLNLRCPAVVFSTFLGGRQGEIGYGVAVDSEGDAYLAGDTGSPDFRTENPLQPAIAGGTDAFVAKFSVTDAITLEPDTPLPVTLTDAVRGQFFKIFPPTGRLAVIELTDPDEGDANSLHLSWDEVPCPGSSDLVAAERSQANQTLVVPWSREQEAWILARAEVLNGDSNELSLLLRFEDLVLERMSATYSGQGGPRRLSAAIQGAGFTEEIAFRLVGPGRASLPASATVVVSTFEAETVFDLDGAEVGTYDLVAEVPGLPPVALEGVFNVDPAEEGPLLEITLESADAYRYDDVGRLSLRYRNTGDEEMIAPLFKVVGPTETRLRLEQEAVFQEGELFCLGTHPQGVPGRLPPGGEGHLSVVFQSTHCLSCPIEFEVHLFTPRRGDTVGWETLSTPAGMSAESWAVARTAMSTTLGGTWSEVHESLARLATRLSRRGTPAASARELFRFATREALGRPSAAILGRVTSAGNAAPLAGESVLALDGANVVSSALTDTNGFYTIDFLGGQTYEVAIAGHRIVSTRVGSTSVTMQPAEDALFFDIEAEPGANDLEPACPNCIDEGLPSGPLVPPSSLFTPVASRQIGIVSSVDPNDKGGPGELEGPIPPEQRIEYRIFFQNDPEATAAARTVEIIDWLDPTLFDVGSIEFGKVTIAKDPGQSFRFTQESSFRFWDVSQLETMSIHSSEQQIPVLQVSDGQTSQLDVNARIDLSLDPACQEACEPSCDPSCAAERHLVMVKWEIDTRSDDPLAGFLLPDDERDQGKGEVSFTVRPVGGLAHDTELENDAVIIFDGLAEVRTGVWRNRIDLMLPPGTPRFPRPRNGAVEVPVDTSLQWSAPTTNETFDVFLWPASSSRPAQPTASGVTHLSLRDVVAGAGYRWQVVARNSNGMSAGPEWSFTTEVRPTPFHRGDANDDGLVDVSDAVFTLLYLFDSGLEPPCLEAANVDNDGAVEMADVAFLLMNVLRQGPPPPAPGPPPMACGLDPEADQSHLGCRRYRSCAPR